MIARHIKSNDTKRKTDRNFDNQTFLYSTVAVAFGLFSAFMHPMPAMASDQFSASSSNRNDLLLGFSATRHFDASASADLNASPIEIIRKGKDGRKGRNASVVTSARVGEHGQAGEAVTYDNNQNINAPEGSAVVIGSEGGAGGKGGRAWIFTKGDARRGGFGGEGKSVSLVNSGNLTSTGAAALKVFSKGGKGGQAGDALGSASTARSVQGGNGGNAGRVDVENSGSLTTYGDNASGAYIASTGGDGGNGGFAASTTHGRAATGGDKGNAGSAGDVSFKNSGTITTNGKNASAISINSTGGHGGHSGWAVGASEGASSVNVGFGGSSGAVEVENTGNLFTIGNNSAGIDAASVGGRGGNGGFAVAKETASSGPGGDGASADKVTINNKGSISTKGEGSSGIVALSLGGGGGNSGWSVAGGSAKSSNGAKGSVSGAVVVNNDGQIITEGHLSAGIVASSSGGSGGNGGFSVAGRSATSGEGGAAGSSSTVSVINEGVIATKGDYSNGISASSTGGSGGNSGWSIAVAAATSGNAGSGGSSDKVSVANNGEIETSGAYSSGLVARSTGGSGGNGGFSVAGGAGKSGNGGSGGNAGSVTVINNNTIVTNGDFSSAIIAHSNGGKGGNSGWSVAGGKANSGNGGSGGNASGVSVTAAGNIHTSGADSIGISAVSRAGSGGNAGFSSGVGAIESGHGGNGGTSGEVTVTNSAEVITIGANSTAIEALSAGGKGGNAGWSVGAGYAKAGRGGAGGESGDLIITNSSLIGTSGENSVGIIASSLGGEGGNGGFSVAVGMADSGSGGAGGASGNITINNSGSIITEGAKSSAIIASSIGGKGGAGGWAVAGANPTGGPGGKGGSAGNITFSSAGIVATEGVDADAINILSQGGDGGAGGFHAGVYAHSGAGGDGGVGGNINFSNTGYVQTVQSNSAAVVVRTKGGAGGNSGLHIGAVAVGGNGGAAGHAGNIAINNSGWIVTGPAAQESGIFSDVSSSAGIIAESVGGAGGNSSLNITTFAFGTGAYGGTAGNGGKGDAIEIAIGAEGGVLTWGDESTAITARSLGGAGGNGGDSYSIASGQGALAVGIGSVGGNGGSSGLITIKNEGLVVTHGAGSAAIIAETKAGNGGAGGSTVAAAPSTGPSLSFAMSRQGGDGGIAGAIDLSSSGAVITNGDNATAIYAVSNGGDGGAGGKALAVSASPYAGAIAVGGNGGNAGAAGAIDLVNSGLVLTKGTASAGIVAMSIGGNGGQGGSIASASGATNAALGVSIAGSGGNGASAGQISVVNDGGVYTLGNGSAALIASSRGGHGGAGGAAYVLGVANQFSGGFSGSNAGGAGGKGETVTVTNNGIIATEGSSSAGVLAESIGGNGGDGGLSATIAGARTASVFGTWSGKGGDGADGSNVSVIQNGSVYTKGEHSSAVQAISVGGAGGAGGNALALAGALNPSAAANGGGMTYAQAGGGGANAGAVSIVSGMVTPARSDEFAIVTIGNDSKGLSARSEGGAGGAGGNAASVALAYAKNGNTLSISDAGNGGHGGNAGVVTINSADNIYTQGNGSVAVEAVSLGGAGGAGGHAGAINLGGSTGTTFNNGTLAIGGSGGNGGLAQDVSVITSGKILTIGDHSGGILAHSIGGDGGASGHVVSGAAGLNENIRNISGNVGGTSGNGGEAGTVIVTSSNMIVTAGSQSAGVDARSIGGSGGKISALIAADIGGSSSTNGALSWARTAGDGAKSSDVQVQNSGDIITLGDGSSAIFALSDGGDGGASDYSIAASAGLQGKAKTDNFSIAVGGSAGAGAASAQVTIGNAGLLATQGNRSHGIFVQSVGGVGGKGGSAIAATASLTGKGKGQLRNGTVSWGGSGGGGGAAANVTINQTGNIFTEGEESHAINAASLGGNGGAGGDANQAVLLFRNEGSKPEDGTVAGEEDKKSPAATSYQLLVSGAGGKGSKAGNVDIVNDGNIQTIGRKSSAIFAQSIGGSGGDAGNTALIYSAKDLPVPNIDKFIDKDAKQHTLAVGGTGGAGGAGGVITISNTAIVETLGAGSAGIKAQSLGGKGGSGGAAQGGAGIAIGGGALTGIIGSVAGAFEGGSSIAKTIAEWAKAAGAGGNADTVTIKNGVAGNFLSGLVVTRGEEADAIVARSIGGDAGKGGSAFGSYAIGGDGGIAGNGSDVDVANYGYLLTQGAGSGGIVAMSAGGKGGAGGAAGSDGDSNKGVYTLGGRGGHGGEAGVVTILNQGMIETAGKGILAQSLGGSGGDAGASYGKTLALGGGFLDGLVGNNASWFGRSGAGGNAAAVTISNGVSGDLLAGAIMTRGAGADAIVARSIGGDGGKGGLAIASGTEVKITDDFKIKLGFSIAGDGGVAGNGAAVDVTNNAYLKTHDAGSAGIHALSSGGQGGTGGSAGLDADKKNGIFTFGGRGGHGGNAGAVKILNRGVIETAGKGILAQSLGGSGGDAGASHGVAIAFGGGFLDALIGNNVDWFGRSGAGGNAAAVTVKNGSAGAIITNADDAGAIGARAIGGDGGKGGSASGFVASGGDGGIAGAGAEVNVTNNALLFTQGARSTAIEAVSQGGQGGVGGEAGYDSTNALKILTMGGRGGHGGNAAVANIINQGSIETSGHNSHGVLALSAGGAGGNAGQANSFAIGLGGAAFDAFFEERSSWYGRSGQGGHADAVGVVNGEAGNLLDGSIRTRGDESDAIIARSAGGAAGAGGAASALGEFKIMGNYQLIALGAAIGGDGGAGGKADVVDVINYGQLHTAGAGSRGIVAESLGGAGGNGGAATVLETPGRGSDHILSFAVGGLGGNGGDAGHVAITNLGAIHTEGNAASAIFAQSVGGNGGAAGDGVVDVAGYMGIGGGGSYGPVHAVNGHGGAAGNVGIVNGQAGSALSGRIVTSGDDAFGIFAQSHGGKGSSGGAGSGKNARDGNAGDGGNAGKVSIENHGVVLTSGDRSSAIVAQSLAGEAGDTYSNDATLQGSAGKASSISIVNSAELILTSGSAANGITAKSIGTQEPDPARFYSAFLSDDDVGNISIAQTGSIIAPGADSYGIYAESAGAGSGNIDIVVHADGIVVGGDANGAGIGLIGGKDNSLGNSGTITAFGSKQALLPDAAGNLVSVGWIDGLALHATTGSNSISNMGILAGSISLGAGVNTLYNHKQGWLLAGETIALGDSAQSVFTNAGNLSLGGYGHTIVSKVTGNFVQTETGNLVTDLDYAAHEKPIDRLDVTRKAKIAGVVNVKVSNVGHAKSGVTEYTLINSNEGIQNDGLVLDAPSTATLNYSLDITHHDVTVVSNVNFLVNGLTENGLAVAAAVHDIQNGQVSPDFRPVATALIGLPDVEALQRAYDSISGEGTAGIQQSYFSQNNAFVGAVLQQDDLPKGKASATPWRAWFSGFGGKNSLKGDATVVGSGDFESSGTGIAAGVNYLVTPDHLIGFAVGVGNSSFKVPQRATSGELNSGHVALHGAVKSGNFYLKGLGGVDVVQARTTRLASIDPSVFSAGFRDVLSTDYTGYGLNLRVEGGYSFDWGAVRFTPFAAAQISSLYMDGALEKSHSGSGALALRYGRHNALSLPVYLGAQFDTQMALSDTASLSLYLRAAWMHEFMPKRPITASFATAPGYDFTVHGAEAPRDSALVEAGFNLKVDRGLSLYGKASGNFARGAQDLTASGGLRIQW